MNKFLEQYRDGEPAEVWRVLHSYPSISTLPRSARREIWEVVTEAMDRVKKNVNILAERLQAQGYEFADGSSPMFGPSPNAQLLSGWFALEYGCIPSVMKAWIEHVGDVSFMGSHPRWQSADILADPMVVEFEYKRHGLEIEGLRSQYHRAHDTWFDSVVEKGIYDAGPFYLKFAPSAQSKAQADGGSSYRMLFPSNTVDVKVVVKGKMMFFTEYLNHCFQWGGFPGFANAEPGADSGVIDSLKEGLFEI